MGARRHTIDDAIGSPVLVVGMEGGESPSGRDLEGAEQDPCSAGVLAQDHVGLLEGGHRPRRHVAEVADRGCDEDQPPAHATARNSTCEPTATPAASNVPTGATSARTRGRHGLIM